MYTSNIEYKVSENISPTKEEYKENTHYQIGKLISFQNLYFMTYFYYNIHYYNIHLYYKSILTLARLGRLWYIYSYQHESAPKQNSKLDPSMFPLSNKCLSQHCLYYVLKRKRTLVQGQVYQIGIFIIIIFIIIIRAQV
jgi:hypothetical protein